MNPFMGGGAKKEAELSCSHWAFVLGGLYLGLSLFWVLSQLLVCEK